MNNYHKQSQFSQVRTSGNIEARIAALEAELSSTHQKINTELRNIERSSPGSQLLLVVGGSGSSSSSAVVIGGYAAKEVTLTAGTHTVSFGMTFAVPFTYFVWASGTVNGEPTTIGCRVISFTNSDITVNVDDDCVLHHLEIPKT